MSQLYKVINIVDGRGTKTTLYWRAVIHLLLVEEEHRRLRSIYSRMMQHDGDRADDAPMELLEFAVIIECFLSCSFTL